MSSIDDISNLNESLTQGGKYSSNKSELLGSFSDLQENANEVIHSTIEQFLPGHFDAVDPSGAFYYQAPSGVTDVSFVDTTTTDISLNILIDNFKHLAGEFNSALSSLKSDAGYLATDGTISTYDLSFGYATGADIATKLAGGGGYVDPDDPSNIYFVSRVNDTDGSVAPSFQYSKLIDYTTKSGASDPSDFIDNANAPDHLKLTCGNLPEISTDSDFWTVNETAATSIVNPNTGNSSANAFVNGDMLAIDNQSMNDLFDIGTTSNLQAAGRRMCNPYNIIQDAGIYSAAANEAGQKFAKVTYLAMQIKALVEEMNRRINAGAKITDDEGNEIALTLTELNARYDEILEENANVDGHLETESLKFDSENMVYIGMLIATVTVLAVGFTSLAKRTDMI